MNLGFYLRAGALAGLLTLGCGIACAQAPDDGPPDQRNPLVDTRCGGALAATAAYNRGGTPPGLISPATGWYHYGFPVSTYRWGWFGAEHYYPTVWCHTGYYGDCTRIAYRCGY